MLEAIGLKLIDVLTRAYDSPFSIKSNFAREEADVVAAAASLGMLTTILPSGVATREWRVTTTGLTFIKGISYGT